MSARDGAVKHQHRAVTVLVQLVVLTAVVIAVWYFGHVINERLTQKGINTGFGFLWTRAGFDLSESMIAFSGDKSYAYALLAGFSNTLKVALCAIVFSVLLGVLAALAQLSKFGLARRIAKVYVSTIRNTPLLLQLFFWFAVFTYGLPVVREALEPLPGLFISNRGVNFPWPNPFALTAIVAIFCTVVAFILRSVRTGGSALKNPGALLILLSLIAFVSTAYALWSGQMTFEWPTASKFSIGGGGHFSPEFMSMFIGLSVYTGTYIAEAIRGAVQSIAQGQIAAGYALGLTHFGVLRYIVMPQAFRIAMPAVVSELLNLMKNSSLGVAVGYPELVSAGNTAMNQTGQAIELISIFMLVYVTVNIITTQVIGLWEKHYVW